MRQERVLKVRWVWLVVPMCVLLGLGMGTAKAPDRGRPPGVRLLREAREARSRGEREKALRIHELHMDFRMADGSLLTREQVDFLLTPALLVQEAVSDDVVLTYPEE